VRNPGRFLSLVRHVCGMKWRQKPVLESQSMFTWQADAHSAVPSHTTTVTSSESGLHRQPTLMPSRMGFPTMRTSHDNLLRARIMDSSTQIYWPGFKHALLLLLILSTMNRIFHKRSKAGSPGSSAGRSASTANRRAARILWNIRDHTRVEDS
jgi:hypothetical protein